MKYKKKLIYCFKSKILREKDNLGKFILVKLKKLKLQLNASKNRMINMLKKKDNCWIIFKILLKIVLEFFLIMELKNLILR